MSDGWFNLADRITWYDMSMGIELAQQVRNAKHFGSIVDD